MNLDSVWTRLGQQYLPIRQARVYAIRCILGHASKRGDMLHRHYASLDVGDVPVTMNCADFQRAGDQSPAASLIGFMRTSNKITRSD